MPFFHTILGTIFGPILAGPFLAKQNKTNETSQMPSSSPAPFDSIEISASEGDEAFETRIKVPFLIISSLLVLAALWMLISQIIRVSI